MYALNKTQLIGHVTETPEMRQTGSGASVTDLNIEIKTTGVKRDDGKNTSTTFLTVTLWRGLADIAGKYVQKGSQVYVSGRLETDSWEDDQGNKKYKTKMVADDMILLQPKDGPLPTLTDSLSIAGGLNKAEVIGNVTQDPELKTTPNGNMVTSFGVATNRQWKDNSGEMQERTEFHNIVAWGNLAEEITKHVTKGRKVYVCGRVQTRSWDGPDGQKRYTTEIVADELKSLGHAYEHGGAAPVESATTAAAAATAATTAVTEDVPEVNYESEIKPEDLPF